jgi:hypothetical protein
MMTETQTNVKLLVRHCTSAMFVGSGKLQLATEAGFDGALVPTPDL